MRDRVYADHAATSFPKPACVHEAMVEYATALGASPGRGAYAESREAGRLLAECRRRIARLINGEDPDHVVFTLNCSDALNLAIRGLLPLEADEPAHAITTWMDHNSILRPLNELTKRSRGRISQTRVKADPKSGRIDPADVERAIRPETKLIALQHGSNVTGTLQPIGDVAEIARRHGIPLLVDAAQTAGHCPIDVQRLGIDLLAMPGHKGLLGPLGTGALYIRPGLEERLQTSREGGTGSVSEDDAQPAFMPDKFEPGSHNAIGLVGLAAAVGWILERGVESLWAHERRLIERFRQRLAETDAPGMTVYGPEGVDGRCAVFSVRVEGFEPAELAAILEDSFGVLTRAGLHCAPLAHRTIGTADAGGTTRLSFGAFNTDDDVERAAAALAEVGRRAAV